MPHHLINFIKTVNPEHLIPIHTEQPHFFETFFRNSDINIIIPTKYEPINLQ
jgi:mRNA degradation ribonuclease J1/J2